MMKIKLPSNMHKENIKIYTLYRLWTVTQSMWKVLELEVLVAESVLQDVE